MLVLFALEKLERSIELLRQVWDFWQDILPTFFESCWSWIQIFYIFEKMFINKAAKKNFIRYSYKWIISFEFQFIVTVEYFFVYIKYYTFFPNMFSCFCAVCLFFPNKYFFFPVVPARGTPCQCSPLLFFLNPPGYALGVRNVIDFLEWRSPFASFRSLSSCYMNYKIIYINSRADKKNMDLHGGNTQLSSVTYLWIFNCTDIHPWFLRTSL